MKPDEWTQAHRAALMAPVYWRSFYPVVEAAVKAFLVPGVPTYTTAELVEGIFPERFAKGDGITARRKVFDALKALAEKGLAPYATRADKRMSSGRIKHEIRPWLWHPVREAPPAPSEGVGSFQDAIVIGAGLAEYARLGYSQITDAAGCIWERSNAEALSPDGGDDQVRGGPDTRGGAALAPAPGLEPSAPAPGGDPPPSYPVEVQNRITGTIGLMDGVGSIVANGIHVGNFNSGRWTRMGARP